MVINLRAHHTRHRFVTAKTDIDCLIDCLTDEYIEKGMCVCLVVWMSDRPHYTTDHARAFIESRLYPFNILNLLVDMYNDIYYYYYYF